jgi:hypothetical protein
MTAFLRRFAPLAFGILSGFDRLVFRGSLRNLAYPAGLQHYLWANRIPFKDFHGHSEAVTARLIDASEKLVSVEWHLNLSKADSHLGLAKSGLQAMIGV